MTVPATPARSQGGPDWDKSRNGETLNYSEILDSAADYMDEHGWTRGTLRNDRGEVCLRGAIVCSVELVPLSVLPEAQVSIYEAQNILLTEIRERDGRPTLGAITAWNDMVCPSKDEAVHMLRMAAKRAEATGC